MLLANQRTPTKRGGTTVVEMAAVVSIFCLLLFGILEYTMVVYTYNIMQNAAREGARYAVVNSEDATLVADTQTYVRSLMAGLDKTNTNYSCSVYLSNSSGVSINSKTSDATTAQFGQYIGVQVTLTYKPLTPGLMMPSSSWTMTTTCYMTSEAN